MTKLNPKNGYVILKPVEEGEQTIGKIVMPDLGKERPEMGEVIATSPTYNYHKGEYVPSELSVGEIVFIPKLGSQRITIKSDTYYITKETEVLASITEE